ncbi:unnamed protein product [Closterium sp. NIES-64]|nr:unnamed protein product [Closterium sp. NIES-64]
MDTRGSAQPLLPRCRSGDRATLLHYCVHLLEAHSDLLAAHLPPALPLTSLLASCEWAELRSWLLFNVAFTLQQPPHALKLHPLFSSPVSALCSSCLFPLTSTPPAQPSWPPVSGRSCAPGCSSTSRLQQTPPPRCSPSRTARSCCSSAASPSQSSTSCSSSTYARSSPPSPSAWPASFVGMPPCASSAPPSGRPPPAQITAFADDCAICREPLSSAKRLPCGHLFHLSCLRSWLEHGSQAPYSCPPAAARLTASPPNVLSSLSPPPQPPPAAAAGVAANQPAQDAAWGGGWGQEGGWVWGGEWIKRGVGMQARRREQGEGMGEVRGERGSVGRGAGGGWGEGERQEGGERGIGGGRFFLLFHFPKGNAVQRRGGVGGQGMRGKRGQGMEQNGGQGEGEQEGKLGCLCNQERGQRQEEGEKQGKKEGGGVAGGGGGEEVRGRRRGWGLWGGGGEGARGGGGEGARGGGGGWGMGMRMGVDEERMAAMVAQVEEVLPHVPSHAIRQELLRRPNVLLAVNALMDAW